MMPNKQYHTLTYLLATSSYNHKTTLQEDLEGLLDDFDTVDKREVEYNRKIISGIKFEKFEGMFLLRIAASVNGEKASTIPNISQGQTSLEMSEVDPPEGFNFTNGDLLCLIENNNVYACQSLMRDDMLYHFLKRLFSKKDMDVTDSSWNLDFVHKISADKFAYIKKYGIKRITLNAFTNSSEVFGYSAKKDGNLLERLFKNDVSLYDNARSSSAKVSLSISRSRFGKEYEWLEKEAEKVLSSTNSQYIIVTGDNTKMTPSDIIVHKRVLFTPLGKSVMLDEGIAKLKEFRDGISSEISQKMEY